jgi:DMATS type aromatic prenyltransferase
MGSLTSTQAHSVSLGALGRRKLRALSAALDLSDELTAQAHEVFSLMSGSWGDWAVGDAPAWPNDISDDGTPFEFSASFDGGAPRLRMLAESQTEPISEHSSWAAGLQFGQRLRDKQLADMSVFEQIQDLFAPRPGGAQSRFSLWHAAVIEEGQPALFKAYVNPCILGTSSAPYVVEQALHRLGFNDAWAFLEQCLADNSSAQIRYFSVDLAAPEEARVKVYVGCAESAQAVDRLIEGARNSEPDDAQRWLRTLTATQGPFDARPILSCFSFRRDLMTPDVTVHVPIRCYVKHDAEALARVSKLLTATDAGRLSRALNAVSDRPLDVGRGLLTYASLRREAAAVRVTVYLAPEAYSITSRRPSVPAPSSDFSSGVHKTSPRNEARLLDVHAQINRQVDVLHAHPLLSRLRQPGTPAQAQSLISHLSLLVLWLGDLFRIARERATDPQIGRRLAVHAAAAGVLAQQLRAELDALGLSAGGLSLYSEEHTLIREVAFAQVADLISAEDDFVRLGMVLAVSATSEELVRAGLAFTNRALGDAEAPRVDDESFSADGQLELSLAGMPAAVAADVHAAANRCFESLLRVVTALERATFSA